MNKKLSFAVIVNLCVMLILCIISCDKNDPKIANSSEIKKLNKEISLETEVSDPEKVDYVRSESDTSTLRTDSLSLKLKLESYYENPWMKEYYTKRIYPPKFDYNIDLESKSIQELRFLRNEIFARNGYLFNDAVLRGYFNRFDWYQPIFDIDSFKVELNKEEIAFVNKTLATENKLRSNRYIDVEGSKMIKYDHIMNTVQFNEVPSMMIKSLSERNMAVVPGDHSQLFFVYDNNHYTYTPNFITTDLYLQILHKHFSSMLQEIEEEHLLFTLKELLYNLYHETNQLKKEIKDEEIVNGIDWLNTYLAIGYTLLTEDTVSVNDNMKNIFDQELENIEKLSTSNSEYLGFIGKNQFDYSSFKVRGNYTKTEELKKYFRCVSWLNSAPMKYQIKSSKNASIILAYLIANSERNYSSFDKFNSVIEFIAGEEDNLSISNMIKIIKTNFKNTKIDLILNSNNIQKITQEIAKGSYSKINKNNEPDKKNSILFTAGRYSFDAEIFIRLVNIIRPEIKRPFPKGLDIFAVFGNETAEDILINDYKEVETWTEYADSLAILKSKFKNKNDWNTNIYNKTMEMILAIQRKEQNYPLFMLTKYWDIKNLSTSLSAWAELKHDMILYSEQPFCAQGGQGGGPPPPQHLSYVEPNIHFWHKAIELLQLEQEVLNRFEMNTENLKNVSKKLLDMGEYLMVISQKQLKNELITEDEFIKMSWIGAEIENLLFSILKTDHLSEREKNMAIIADTYSYNGSILENGVGYGDEIYVVAEINGFPYLTKGAVFSYYEFVNDKRLTDEEWQGKLKTGKIPERPIWVNKILVNCKSLISNLGYNSF